MRLALIGYGKMGKTIHEIAKKQNVEVAFIIDQHNSEDINLMNANNVDVAIEFSNPENALKNISYCMKNNIPVVSGTTGWLQDFDKAVGLCEEYSGAMMYASNYSIGVNIFFELNKFLAQRMSNYRQYKSSMEEIHHTEKLDAPSGTGITLAEGLIDNHSYYQGWENNPTDKEHILPLISKRIPAVPGTHLVQYISDIDEIEIKHTAHSRMGFAQGAFDAARWIIDRKGVFSMYDMLFS